MRQRFPRALPWLLGATLTCTALLAPAPTALAQPTPAPAPAVEQAYVLRAGDTLNLGMIANEGFNLQQQPIRPDGRLSVPLLGDVKAAGLTVQELSELLTRSYGRYYVRPRLMLSIANIRPFKINVLGLVNRPGAFETATPIDLLTGLALAGGLDRDRADPRMIEVRRASGDRHTVSLPAVMTGQAPSEVLQDGDTVYVAEVAGVDWNRVLPPLATAVSILASVAVITWNIKH